MLVSVEGISPSSWLRQGLTPSRVLLILPLSLVGPFYSGGQWATQPWCWAGALSLSAFHLFTQPMHLRSLLSSPCCAGVPRKTHLCLHNVALICFSNANLRGSFLFLWGRLKDSTVPASDLGIPSLGPRPNLTTVEASGWPDLLLRFSLLSFSLGHCCQFSSVLDCWQSHRWEVFSPTQLWIPWW